MISADTSVIVRYLVGTPPAQAKRAAAIVDHEAEIGIPLVALVETAHVLRTQYGVARADVVEVLIELLTRENVSLLGLPNSNALGALIRARALSDSPLPDALIAASAEWAAALPLYTFDKQMGRLGIAIATP